MKHSGRMKHPGIICLLLFLTGVTAPPATAASQETTTRAASPPFVVQAREIAAAFQERLKAELQNAMRTGGPRAAIRVCHSRAPEIAREVGAETGWEIGRTSLKPRNTRNAPSPQQEQVMRDFEQARQDGAALRTLEWWNKDGTGLDYMKAIPAKGMCMTCHGKNIPPDVRETIDKFYPQDTATGFAPGDIRGAFVLHKPLR